MTFSAVAIALLANIGLSAAIQPGALNVPGAPAVAGGSVPPQATSIEYLRKNNRVELVPVGKALTPAQRVVKDFQRHGKKVPTAIQIAATQTGSVQATGVADGLQYNAPVTIGSTTFLLDFDTGSSDLWVFSDQLPASEQGSHTIYNDTGSDAPGVSWSIGYTDGSSASGNVWVDSVTIGGVTATIQAVEAATSVSSSLTTELPDGRVGLAFDSLNQCSPSQCYTFMHQVAPTLPKNLFTATLRKGKPGTYDFGFVDPSEYTGKLAYTKVNNGSGTWDFHATGYSVGTAAQTKPGFATIADTGTSLAYLPPAIAKAYYAQVTGAIIEPGSGFYSFPCTSTLPNFNVFLAGGHEMTLPGSYINLGRFYGRRCLGGVQPDTLFPNSILGDVFLKSQFVVFDRSVPRLGFAQQKGLPTS